MKIEVGSKPRITALFWSLLHELAESNGDLADDYVVRLEPCARAALEDPDILRGVASLMQEGKRAYRLSDRPDDRGLSDHLRAYFVDHPPTGRFRTSDLFRQLQASDNPHAKAILQEVLHEVVLGRLMAKMDWLTYRRTKGGSFYWLSPEVKSPSPWP